MSNLRPIKTDESGLASIVITTILTIVISLIVIGTLQTVRRNERDALDRQLSAQAFYAAESGVNDAIKAIQTGYAGYASSAAGESNDSGTGNKTHCSPDINGGTPPSPLALSTNSNQLNSGVQYTCLLINQTPKDAVYTVGTDQATGIDISAGSQISNLILVWNDPDVTNPANQKWDNPSGKNFFPNFPALSDWNANVLPLDNFPLIGVLRAAITNLDCSGLSGGHCWRGGNGTGSDLGASPYIRAALNNDTYTAYFYPRPAGGGAALPVCGGATLSTPSNGSAIYIDDTYNGNALQCQGQIMQAACGFVDNSHLINGSPIDATHACLMNISMTNAHSKHFFIRLNSIYTRSSITISAWNGATNLPLTNTQAVIDVTGRAQDVLRRIQVRVPIGQSSSNINPPLYALQVSNGVCKEIQVGLNYGQNDPSRPECNW